MSNVFPIRQDDTFDWTDWVRDRDASIRLFNEVMQEHDRDKAQLEQAARDARDRGRIEGMLAASVFVIAGLTIASIVVI